MGTITLPNFRTTADVTMNTRLKDGGVAIDWAGLSNIKAWLYSDAQKAIAGRCDVSIDQTDSTKLVCEYSATKPQYLGVQRLIVQAKYMGRTKTYDKAVFNFVPRTADQEGTQIVIDDPEVDVEIEVEDISSSLIERLIAACIKVTEEARDVVDVNRGPEGLSAYEVAVENGFEGTEEEWLLSLQGKSAYEIAVELGYEGTEEQWIASLKGEDGEPGTTPHIGQNGNWFIGDVDTGVSAGGQNGVTPHIGQNGNWFIGDTDTGVLARGTNGVTPHIGDNGHWFIGDTDTNVVAEGQDGNPGITPHIGANNHWFIGETDTGILAEGTDGVTPAISIGTVTTVEPGTPAAASMSGTSEAPVLNLSIPKGLVGATPNITVGTVTTGEPGTPVVVTLTGTAAAPVLNIQIPQGMQGNTGSSVDYPYELVNNLTTNDATKGLSAQQGKVLKDELSQLEAEVGDIDERTENLDADEEDALLVTDGSNIIAKIDKDGVETTSVRTKQTNPLFYKDKVFITDANGNVIFCIDADGIKTTKIHADNVLINDWLGKKVATYGDSVTAVNNGDFQPPYPITQNNWGNRVAEYYKFGKQYGRGIGSTCFMWRGTSGGQVAWCKTDTGEYVNRNDSYTYDNYEGHVTIPSDCTPVRGDGCSWLRIVTMFPESLKDSIDAILVMFHNDYHQDMDTEVEWIENSQTDPEWAASDEYSTLGGDYNIGTVQGGIASVVMKLQAWMPQARIILMTPISGVYATDDGLDGDFDNTQSALMHTLAGVVKDIASRMSIPVIDNFSRDGINSLNRSSYIYDNIHPYTAKGSKALAASVIGQMKTILPAL